MGLKRSHDNCNDVVEPSLNGNGGIQEYDSDESLHLPAVIYSEKYGRPKKKKKERRMSGTPDVHECSSPSKELPMEQQNHKTPTKKDKKTDDARFAVFLIRKPIELSPEDLSGAHIPVDSCSSREKRVAINDKAFTIRASGPSVQMFHIPAEIIHSSEKSRFKGIGNPISGTVVISRAEFDQKADISNKEESLTDLPFKAIKKKVSRKGFQNLRQRLKANGVKQWKKTKA
uniref:Uncharacterized protein n=1 Tax=Haemonchus contortus TaxID=6289 RepID=A0A7I4Y5L7_HAECO